MPEVTVRTVLALARRGVLFELRLYRSLFRWLTRRPDIPASAQPVGYAQTVTPVMWLWIFASAAELPLVHVLVPWETLRISLLAVGVWGLVWMVGLLASLKVYPHLLAGAALHVRYGASTHLRIPWDSIAAIEPGRRDLPSTVRSLQPRQTELGTDLQVGVSGQVNVHAVLRGRLAVPTHQGELEITELSFLVDDPRAFVAAARQHLRSGAPGRTGPADPQS